MALSKDEARGIIGQLEVEKQAIQAGQEALVDFVGGRRVDINAISRLRAVDVSVINQRLADEQADPDGIFGV